MSPDDQTATAAPERAPLDPLEEGVDHVRGPSGAAVILEYGDYECPYSREAFRNIERVERAMDGQVRFAYRHFPLVQIHSHALGAAAAAEAAARQNRFWDMHEVLFYRQEHLADSDLQRYAEELGLDVARFNSNRSNYRTLSRVGRDVGSGLKSREVNGTPTIFINGVVHRGDYDAATLIQAMTSAR